MTAYQLLQPVWLWLIPLLLLVPWLLKHGWLISIKQKLPATAVRHPLAGDYQTPTDGQKTTQYLYLSIICGCLMLLALAQPVRLGAHLPTPPKPVDLMLIIDTSISMTLKDYQLEGQSVDRLTMTQVLLDRFSRRYSGKRIGIVVLGDQPHILLQPSEDRELVRHLIHRLKPVIAGRQAALGDAVAIAAEQIKSDHSTTETVMVLISDAVLPSGSLSPVAGAQRAVKAGAILHTIAIGSTDMRTTGQASLIYEPADLELLRQMAGITGGQSFHATDVDAMDAALLAIEKRQQQTVDDIIAPQLRQPLYLWPLGLAILLLIIMTLLPYRSTAGANH